MNIVIYLILSFFMGLNRILVAVTISNTETYSFVHYPFCVFHQSLVIAKKNGYIRCTCSKQIGERLEREDENNSILSGSGLEIRY
jgi:hypothetical protein